VRISAQDTKYVLVFAAIATMVASGAAYTLLSPPSSEQFYAMYILGSTGLAEHYYPNDNPNLPISHEVNWTLGVYNHMGSLEYVIVRVKLLNSTITSPDELTGTPSPVQEIFEFSRILVDNETWSIPFVWEILNLTRQGSSLQITEMAINQTLVSGVLGSAISGINFRLVFELWFYEPNANSLTFSWISGGTSHSVWTQIWFNATSTT